MPEVKAHLSISLDGYAAGPDQSLENPLGRRGEELHEWMTSTAAWRENHGESGGEDDGVDSEIAAAWDAGIGAFVMGRKMFGGGDGAWDESWHGWWGEDPPYHAPVFVLTHHPREPLEMDGGTTFYFVTEGFESALSQAREAAGGQDVLVAGGASTVNQGIAAGLIDELHLHVAPILLGDGERLFEGIEGRRLELIDTVGSAKATHIRVRFGG